MTRRLALGVAVVLAAVVGMLTPIVAQQPTLPAQLTGREFWTLTETLSEPSGTFASDNLVSNELGFQKILPALSDRHPPGGVYLGVGPEQNFTYIAALKPRMAFIVDIRRGNRDLHLMYKALFELAADRAEFVSLLFARPRPEGLTAESTASEIFAAFENVAASDTVATATEERLIARLTKSHQLPLSDAEVAGIKAVYAAFVRIGPDISYGVSLTRRSAVTGFLGSMRASFGTLMQATDATDAPASFLASAARFSVIKELEAKNLIVPVVGDFAGPKALRAVGEWLRVRGAEVSAFYLSNVEDYLRRSNTWDAFCSNVVTLPANGQSEFIYSGRGGPGVPALPPPAPPAPGAPTGFMVRDSKPLATVQGPTVPNRTTAIVEATKSCR